MIRNILVACALFFVFISCSKDDSDLPDADQYLTWNITGKKGTFIFPADSIAAARFGSDTHITAANANNDAVYLIFSSNNQTGNYPAYHSDIFLDDVIYMRQSVPIKLNITKTGAAGSYLEGTYSGLVNDSVGINYNISGAFRVKLR